MSITIVSLHNHDLPTEADILTTIMHQSYVTLIHNGRNRLWTARIGTDLFVVKHFRRSLKNTIVYAIRSSKAQRSFCHAKELLARGINTPYPLGYAETRNKFGLPGDSWYICRYDPTMSLEEAIHIYGKSCLDAFAAFVAKLHKSGVRHDDLNNTNVRVSLADDGKHAFSLIDLNRMKIYPPGIPIPTDECLHNICRFCDINDGFEYFVKTYLKHMGLPRCLMLKAMMVKARHEQKGRLKNKIKKIIKR